MPRMTGKEALVRLLRAEGIPYVFGNPGATEAPLQDTLQDNKDIKYIVALHEASALAMADGWARASRKPGFLSLHTTVGVANAASMIYNAYKGGTPLVITSGQVSTHLLMQDAYIGSDMADFWAAFTKWSAEPLHAKEVPMAVRRAFKTAKTPPTGPVFLSLPWTVMDEEAELNDVVPSGPGYFQVHPDPRAIEKAASLLAKAQRPVMLIGDRIAQAEGVAEAVALAETLGSPVYAGAMSEVNFPTSHPQFLGALSAINPTQAPRDALRDADVVLVVGTDILQAYFYSEDPILNPNVKIIHLDIKDTDIEKKYPTEVPMSGDPKAGMADLADALSQAMNGEDKENARTRAAATAQEKARRRAAQQQQVQAAMRNSKITPPRLLGELSQVMPKNAIVCGGGVAAGARDFDEPGTLFSMRGGSIGWGTPGSIGVKLARPDRPVVAIEGEGSAMYNIQALWTAGRYNIPVVWVIPNNSAYRIVQEAMSRYLTHTDRSPDHPELHYKDFPLNMTDIARSFGVQATRVEKGEDLKKAFDQAFSAGKPYLVEAMIDLPPVNVKAIQEEHARFMPKR